LRNEDRVDRDTEQDQDDRQDRHHRCDDPEPKRDCIESGHLSRQVWAGHGVPPSR
jgi:hypothetical protein